MRRNSLIARAFVPAAIFCLVLIGCSGEPTTNVTGKVVFEGAPVDGGSVSFIPDLGGKAGEAQVKADGTFQAPCRPGKNIVRYSPPAAEAPKENLKPGETMPQSKYTGLVPKDEKVDLAPTSATVNIELVRQVSPE